jgi:DNA primase
MIPKEVIEEIRYRCDIEDVIGSYVTLKRAGSNRNGLCPFHSEKSPSFTVFPATKSFYCFGCGAGGDVITFIQKIENLDYVGSLEFLAARAGISIPNDSSYMERETVTRKRVYEMNLEAAKFFRASLFDPALGREGMEYLTERRQMSGAVIKHFGLGFAPNDFGMLTRHMKQKGYTDEELYAAFLCGKSQKTERPFDLFRNRIMFPVIDTAGNIVAFGGRVMDDSKPKYLNSADTPGFKKSRILFGLNYAKDHCAEQMILCEGYMDAIAMHAAGFQNAVATLGTAITPDHARLLSRYTKRVVINYDSDEAGQRAANKAMALLDEVGLEVRVLKLTGAKDADEYIRTYGADAFRSIIEKSRTAFDFKLENVLARHDVATADGKIRAARELAAIIAAVGSGVERELYVGETAKALGISKESIANDVTRYRSKEYKKRQEKEHRDVLLSARSFGDRVNPDAAKDPAAANAEENILGLLLLYPEHRKAVSWGLVELGADDFFTDLGRRAFEAVMTMEQSESGFLFSALGEHFNPDEMGRLVRMTREREELQTNDRAVLEAAASALRRMREKRESRAVGDVQGELARRRAEAQQRRK